MTKPTHIRFGRPLAAALSVDGVADPYDGDDIDWSTSTEGGSASGDGNDTTLVTVASAGASETIDVSIARTYDLTLDAASCTLTLTGAVDDEAWFVAVVLRQDGVGGRDVTWPGSVIWPGGVTPELTPDAGAVDVFSLFSLDGGTTWFGFPTGGTGTSTVASLDDLTDVTITSPTEGHELRYRSGTWVNELPASATGHWEIVVADGGSGDAGVNETAYVEMTTQRTTTSGSLADITGASASITLTRSTHVAVWLNCEVSASGSAADLALAISIDDVDHDEVVTHLAAGGTDSGVSSVIHRTASALTAGTYTVKGRFRRAAGSGTAAVDRADLLVMAMGQSGPDPITTDDGSDYIYAPV